MRAIALAACLALASCSAHRVNAPMADAEEGPGVDTLTPNDAPLSLRRSAVADEYFWLRAKALEGVAPAPFHDALAAMQVLRSDFAQDPTAWEDLEVPLGTVTRGRELVDAYASLPESRDVEGRPVALRADALRLARAITASERAYKNGPYRDSAREIDRAASELRTRLLPSFETVLRAMEADMSLPGAPRPVVVTLVGDAPYPGVFAADARGHASASFVRVHGLDGGALVETVLHEALDAMDQLTVRSRTAMNMLREALVQRGLDESDPNVEMAVNTVTFAEAASLVRRYVDAGHHAMGETGFYTLFPPATAIVAAWDRHLSGEPLDATADAIAKAVAP